MSEYWRHSEHEQCEVLTLDTESWRLDSLDPPKRLVKLLEVSA